MISFFNLSKQLVAEKFRYTNCNDVLFVVIVITKFFRNSLAVKFLLLLENFGPSTVQLHKLFLKFIDDDSTIHI